jgi:hypothetical protein
MAPDVVVVEGGPVGLAVAIATRRRGLEVLVSDKAQPPIDKPCGEGVMPEGVSALRLLGVQVDGSDALPFYCSPKLISPRLPNMALVFVVPSFIKCWPFGLRKLASSRAGASPLPA